MAQEGFMTVVRAHCEPRRLPMTITYKLAMQSHGFV